MKKLIAFVLTIAFLFAFASYNHLWCKICNDKADSSTTPPDNGADNNSAERYDYITFTPSEKQKYIARFGEVIPFIPNNEYYVEEYEWQAEYMTTKGIVFVAYGNTQEEFDAYRESFSSYDCQVYVDPLGYTCYVYGPDNGAYIIDMSYFEYEGRFVTQVDVRIETKGGTAGIGTGIPYDELFTNEGAGLPSDSDGVYDLDFTKAEYIKDVTEQNHFYDSCPPTGSPAVLVIPVQFSDVTAESRGFTIDRIVDAFSKDGKTDYYSVYDYYYISSYGQLTLDITVLDFWFTPQYESDYYDDLIFTFEGEEVPHGEQMIIDEALDYLDDFMDLTQFDSDGNGTIDSIVLVNTLEVDSSDYFSWAFRHFNYYRDEAGDYYEYDDVHAKIYMWLSYQFLYETVDEKFNTSYDNVSGMNTETLLHEFGHVLGLDDYYDYTYINHPLFSRDIMYNGVGDQNPYSKFNLGWITTSRLVVTNSSVTLTLEDFSKNGDTIIIANNWEDKLGAYQEYYVLMYYTNSGLDAGEGNERFDNEGVLVYHVNAALYIPEGSEHYQVYNTNTDIIHEQGTENNLIDFVISANGDFIYGVGDRMPTVIDDYGDELIYNFTVDALASDYATITFYKG